MKRRVRNKMKRIFSSIFRIITSGKKKEDGKFLKMKSANYINESENSRKNSSQ
jgi:hypothetical protein